MSEPKRPGSHALPFCLAGEIAPDDVDPQHPQDVALWRSAERKRLRADRLALSVEARAEIGLALGGHLRAVLAARFGTVRDMVFSAYWPIKGEPDLRPVMASLHAEGVTVCLPVVEQKAAPLVFRRWTPEIQMVRGDWNIPVPPPDAAICTPDISLAPLVGWDAQGFRLGYGGGYFDRTLAKLAPGPFTIGIGFQSARLTTIFPQPHDIGLDIILTEAGVQVQRDATVPKTR